MEMVLISGMQGLGAEIAKNLVIAGVKSLTLHDQNDVELWDLCGSFLFSEKDLGKNRAMVCLEKLQRIASEVKLSALTVPLLKEDFKKFKVVVVTDTPVDEAIKINDYCREQNFPITFIKTQIRGLFGSLFIDIGRSMKKFCVDDREAYQATITRGENGLEVKCKLEHKLERFKFKTNDLVVFQEITGMSALNDGKPRTISFTYDRSSFTVKEDPTNHPVHGCECIVKKVREEEINFKPLRAALEKPEFCCYDFSKLDHIRLHHVADQALDGFIKKWNRFPVAGCEVDAEKLIDLVSSLSSGQPNDFIVKLDTRLLRIYAFGARAVLSPMAAMFGGIVAQQVANAWSGDSYPFRQFLYFNSVESLPSEPLDPEDVKPLNSRYDAQISVFGSKLQKQLEAAKVFIVGSDTVACEFLKNAALMGVSCGEGGMLTITDDGLVDNTNVSSGFMFRERDIGREKSKVSVSAAKRINDRLHLEAMQTRVCQETENVFDDIFWEKVDVVINAMDNVEDIFYIDQRCLYYRKAFIESERLGYECSTQPVIPHKTINYGASSLAGLAKHESLRNVYLFPSKIEHCLKWAKSEFDILFEKIPREVNEYMSNPSGYISNRKNRAHARENFQQVLTCLEDKCDTRTFDDCLTWARFKFEVYFVYQI